MDSAPTVRVRRMRGPSGLGDSIYLRPIAEHYARAGDRVEVLSDYPDVFRGSSVSVLPFSRVTKVDFVAHYVAGKRNPNTTQFQDMCQAAGIKTAVPMRFDWTVLNTRLIDELRARAAGRKIVLVHGGRTPMGRTDGFGAELLPSKSAFDSALYALRDTMLVRIGKGAPIYSLATEVDLQDATTVSDLFDLAMVADGIVAQCSFAVPLAEVFSRPLLAVWSAKGMKASHSYVRTITPQKVLSGANSRHVIDDWTDDKIREVARALC